MLKDKIFDEIAAKISEIAALSPVKDLEKNVRALLSSALARLDLVTREEFDIQAALLTQSRAKLDEIEARMVHLECLLSNRSPIPLHLQDLSDPSE